MPNHPTDPNCLFCKIVAGQIPSFEIFQDADVMAFLDVGPLSRGHTLVIPKGHWVTLDEMPSATGAAIGRVLPELARAVMKTTGTQSYNVLQNNGRPAHQAVGHVHFHIIPKPGKEEGLGIHWPAGKLTASDAEVLAQTIAAALG